MVFQKGALFSFQKKCGGDVQILNKERQKSHVIREIREICTHPKLMTPNQVKCNERS